MQLILEIYPDEGTLSSELPFHWEKHDLCILESFYTGNGVPVYIVEGDYELRIIDNAVVVGNTLKPFYLRKLND